jgi:hypothetical protein
VYTATLGHTLMVSKLAAASFLYWSLQGAHGLASSPSFAQQLLNIALKSPLYEKVEANLSTSHRNDYCFALMVLFHA